MYYVDRSLLFESVYFKFNVFDYFRLIKIIIIIFYFDINKIIFKILNLL